MISLSAPDSILGTFELPGSKSISNRVQIIRALSHTDFTISNMAICDDTTAVSEALRSSQYQINIGAAGTAMRFLTAYYAIQDKQICLTGSQRMQERPIGLLVEALRQLGASIEYVDREGYPPLLIRGKSLLGGSISLPAHISSQYTSALLMIAPLLQEGLDLSLEGKIASEPYIEMTLALMADFGIKAVRDNNRIQIAPQSYQTHHYCVESDWSAASYFYQIMALIGHGAIRIPHLYANSLQGDSNICRYFEPLGIQTVWNEKEIIVSPTGDRASHIELDLSLSPDVAQTIAVTAALLHIPFYLTGLETLRIKETDRISALIAELGKLGYLVEGDNSSLTWRGDRVSPESPPSICTYDDHRMAMAFAPAAALYPNIQIQHPEVVSKSFPTYWETLQQMGFHIQKL